MGRKWFLMMHRLVFSRGIRSGLLGLTEPESQLFWRWLRERKCRRGRLFVRMVWRLLLFRRIRHFRRGWISVPTHFRMQMRRAGRWKVIWRNLGSRSGIRRLTLYPGDRRDVWFLRRYLQETLTYFFWTSRRIIWIRRWFPGWKIIWDLTVELFLW